MNYLKLVQLLVLLCLSSCQSNIERAGDEHALVFKKWQALSKYAGASPLSTSKVNLVGELTIKTDEDGSKFILTNLQLAAKETPFQINLLHPSFEAKYICQPQCLQLVEYLQQDNEGATMLSRYFAQQEFELFKLYGEVFLLEEKIQAMRYISNENLEHYINWLIKEKVISPNLTAFISYLVSAISEQSYMAYLRDPTSVYTHLLPSGLSSDFGVTGDGTAEWLDGPTPDEKLLMSLNIVNEQPLIQNVSNFELGDFVCDFNSNEFGSVTEIRGKQIIVQMVGKMWLQTDGLHLPAQAGDIMSNNINKSYTPINDIKTFNGNQIVVCKLN